MPTPRRATLLSGLTEEQLLALAIEHARAEGHRKRQAMLKARTLRKRLAMRRKKARLRAAGRCPK